MSSTPLSEQLRFIGQRDGRPGFDVTCLGFGAATISNHHQVCVNDCSVCVTHCL